MYIIRDDETGFLFSGFTPRKPSWSDPADDQHCVEVMLYTNANTAYDAAATLTRWHNCYVTVVPITFNL